MCYVKDVFVLDLVVFGLVLLERFELVGFLLYLFVVVILLCWFVWNLVCVNWFEFEVGVGIVFDEL